MNDNSKMEKNQNALQVRNLHLETTEVPDVFLQMTPKQIDNVNKCFTSWLNLCCNEYFWEKMCEINGFLEVEISLRWPGYTKFIESFKMYWQGIFHYNRLLQHCWKNDIFKKISYGLWNYYTIEYLDDTIFIIRADCVINIYNTLTRELIDRLTYKRNTGIFKTSVYKHLICFLEFNTEYRLLISSYNMDTGKWRPYTENSEMVNIYDQSELDNFEVFKTIAAIRSDNDSHLYLYNIDTEEIVFTCCDVTSVCFGADTIAFGNNNGTTQFLDLDCNYLMELNHGENVTVKQIKIFEDKLYCVTISNGNEFMDACVWSIREKIKLYQIQAVCSVSHVQEYINKNNFIFYHDKKITIWNFLQENQPLNVEVSMNVSDLISNDRYVITCLRLEPMAKMWCTTTGKLVKIFAGHFSADNPIFITQRSISFVGLKCDELIIQNFTPFTEF